MATKKKSKKKAVKKAAKKLLRNVKAKAKEKAGKKSSESKYDTTVKQRIFVQEYLIDFNGARAAEAAGVPKKSARSMASKWLTKGNIKKAIDKGLKKIEKRTELKQDDVRKKIDNLASLNVGDYLQQSPEGKITFKKLKDLTKAQKECLDAEIGPGGEILKIKFQNKNHALTNSARIRKMFVEKKEFKHNFTINDLLDELDDLED